MNQQKAMTITRDSALSDRVMKRVYLFWGWRKMTTSRVVRLGVLSFFVGLASIDISVIDVLRNVSRINWQLSSLANFFLQASLHTRLEVQLVGVLSLVIMAFFVADIGKAMRWLVRPEAQGK